MPLIEDEFEDTLAIVRRTGPDALLIAVRSGELPHIHTSGHHPADVIPIRTAVRDQLRLDTVVLDHQHTRALVAHASLPRASP